MQDLEYEVGQIVHIFGIIQNGCVLLGTTKESWQVPLEACKIVWADAKRPSVGDIVRFKRDGAQNFNFKLLAIDGDQAWVLRMDDKKHFSVSLSDIASTPA